MKPDVANSATASSNKRPMVTAEAIAPLSFTITTRLCRAGSRSSQLSDEALGYQPHRSTMPAPGVLPVLLRQTSHMLAILYVLAVHRLLGGESLFLFRYSFLFRRGNVESFAGVHRPLLVLFSGAEFFLCPAPMIVPLCGQSFVILRRKCGKRLRWGEGLVACATILRHFRCDLPNVSCQMETLRELIRKGGLRCRANRRLGSQRHLIPRARTRS